MEDDNSVGMNDEGEAAADDDIACVVKFVKSMYVPGTYDLVENFTEGFFTSSRCRTGTRDVIVMMGGRKATPLGRTTTIEGKQVIHFV
jgi:hypothetical protein